MTPEPKSSRLWWLNSNLANAQPKSGVQDKNLDKKESVSTSKKSLTSMINPECSLISSFLSPLRNVEADGVFSGLKNVFGIQLGLNSRLQSNSGPKSKLSIKSESYVEELTQEAALILKAYQC